MRVSGGMACVRATGLRHGPMDRSMSDNGRIIRPMAREFYIIQTEISMKESGLTIRPTAMVPTPTRMVLNMWVNGRMTSRMDLECKNGPMAKNMKESTKMEQKLGRES
jgi:hypothetical protein